MFLAVRISSYGCTWEVWRALKKLELLSAAPRATLTLLSCSPNFPRASITRRYTHAKHEPILNLPYFPVVFHLCCMSGHKTNVSLLVSFVKTIFHLFNFPFSSINLKAKRLGYFSHKLLATIICFASSSLAHR